MTCIVVNSSVVIALSQLGKIRLLNLLYERIYVPQAVYDEVSVRGSGRPGSTELEELVERTGNVEIRSPRGRLAVESLHDPLGLGESEAIVLASELGCIVALDDKMARNKAESLGLEVAGTIRHFVKSL